MNTTTQKKINSLVEEEVNLGNYTSQEDAGQDIIQNLIRNDIKRGIESGRKDIEQGRYKILDKPYIETFVNRLAKKLLPTSHCQRPNAT